MIKICGREVSEDTIKKALKAYCDFEEKVTKIKVYCFKAKAMPNHTFRLAMGGCGDFEWDGECHTTGGVEAHLFHQDDVEELIEQLTKLLKEH